MDNRRKSKEPRNSQRRKKPSPESAGDAQDLAEFEVFESEGMGIASKE